MPPIGPSSELTHAGRPYELTLLVSTVLVSIWIRFGITACAHITSVPNFYFLHSMLMFHPRFDSLSFQFMFVTLGVTPFFLSLVFQPGLLDMSLKNLGF